MYRPMVYSRMDDDNLLMIGAYSRAKGGAIYKLTVVQAQDFDTDWERTRRPIVTQIVNGKIRCGT
jgi:hypothetical protein